MVEDLDSICVKYKASRNVPESERPGSDFEKKGCYDCDGYKKDCEHNVPIGELKFPTED